MTPEQLAEGRKLLERSQHSRWFAYFSTDQCKATLQVPEGWVFEASGARGTMEEAEALAWLRNNGPALLAAAERERRAMDVIDRLLSVQNGCPLPKYQADYDSVNEDALQLLREAGYLDQPRHTDAPPPSGKPR